MVVLDLLDFGSTTPASASVANVQAKPKAAAAPGCFARGDVVMAKYGKTNCFYWAKVLKLYKNGSGMQLCDIQWLRPQAGAPVEKTYVLHDGHDETLQGDGLTISVFVRRPAAAEVTAAAPPGAAASAAASTTATSGSKGVEMTDLLGELIVEKAPQPEAMYFAPQQSFRSSPQLAQQPSLPANMPGSTSQQPIAGTLEHGWANFGTNVPRSGPCSNGFAPQVSSSPWNMPATAQSGFLQSRAPQTVQSNMKTVTYSSNSRGGQNSQDKQFDFISDMMSGALTGSELS